MNSFVVRSSWLALLPALFSGTSSKSLPNVPQAGAFAPFGMEVLPVLQRATDVGPADPDRPLSLCVSMPYARPEAMQAFVDSVSNPGSPDYLHFITPEEVGERFGLEVDQVNQVAGYLRGAGFTLTMISKNRTTILADATVAQASAAFHTTIREYTIVPQNPVEPSRFIAFSSDVVLPASLAPLVLDVSGLET